MAMLKNVFVKVAVLLEQLEAEEGASEGPEVRTLRALLPDMVLAKRERDQTQEEIGGTRRGRGCALR